MHFKNENLTSI